MAIQDRDSLLTRINTLLADNVVKAISEQDVRDVHTDFLDSMILFHKLAALPTANANSPDFVQLTGDDSLYKKRTDGTAYDPVGSASKLPTEDRANNEAQNVGVINVYQNGNTVGTAPAVVAGEQYGTAQFQANGDLYAQLFVATGGVWVEIKEPASSAESYQQTFVAGDFVAGALTITQATHGLTYNANEIYITAVTDNVGELVSVPVTTNQTTGDVTITAGVGFDGRIKII